MTTKPILKITNLHAAIEDSATPVLKGINLTINPGEIHAIMGLNGSGKSTLAHILCGRDGYTVTEGSVEFMGQELLDLDPEERARVGLFLAFQYPVELPGVLGSYFLRTAYNSIRKHRGEKELGVREFQTVLKEKAKLLELSDSLISRPVNQGFSGGEKKRNEIFQMAVLDPKLAILDETDSGLDIDALQVVAKGVNSCRSPERSFLVITHYQRLLDYIVPDFVHVLLDGKIVRTGDKNLALELEAKGYGWIKGDDAVTA
jgi:Fe-S cluster assembly ATP-binding protein